MTILTASKDQLQNHLHIAIPPQRIGVLHLECPVQSNFLDLYKLLTQLTGT